MSCKDNKRIRSKRTKGDLVNMKELKLNNGVLMPNVGIGTFLLEPKDASIK